MFTARYRAIIDHLEQAIAILGAPEPVNAEVHASLHQTIALLEAKLAEEMPGHWSEAADDAKIVKLELHPHAGRAD